MKNLLIKLPEREGEFCLDLEFFIVPNDSDRRDIEGDLGLTGEFEPLGEFGLELRAAATDELGLELGQL